MPAKILVADDDPDVRFMTVFTLRQLGGYDVVEAANGQEAIELAMQTAPDLLVLDVQMPRMNGYEVCRQVREHEMLSETPVILLSAKGQPSEIQEGHESGATLYMLKPYAPMQLIEEVSKLLSA